MTKLFDQEGNASPASNSSIENSHFDLNIQGLETFLLCRQFSTEIGTSLEALFSKYSLSFGKFNILMLLSKSKAGLMPSELAHLCGVTQAIISGLLSGLEKNQIVERQPHQQDGRAFVIRLTEKGNEIFQQLQPEFCKKIERIFLTLDAAEADQLQKLLNKLRIEVQKDNQVN